MKVTSEGWPALLCYLIHFGMRPEVRSGGRESLLSSLDVREDEIVETLSPNTTITATKKHTHTQAHIPFTNTNTHTPFTKHKHTHTYTSAVAIEILRWSFVFILHMGSCRILSAFVPTGKWVHTLATVCAMPNQLRYSDHSVPSQTLPWNMTQIHTTLWVRRGHSHSLSLSLSLSLLCVIYQGQIWSHFPVNAS